jgi:hypothetical protein
MSRDYFYLALNAMECAVAQPPGGEPPWIAPRGPRPISLGAYMATNLFKQAAPGNVPTRGLSLGA